MRLFIAIRFNDAMIEALTDLQADLRECGMTGNFTRPENLHLTLAFIGEYSSPDDVLDAMRAVPFRPFLFGLEGVESYGNLYWAGISESAALTRYVGQLRRALAQRGIPFDRKRFSPHVTLVRRAVFRGGEVRLPRLRAAGETEAHAVSLMRSERGKRGMIYTEIGAVEGE